MRTNYEQSQEIAVHASSVMRDIRQIRDMPSLNKSFGRWLDYARSHGVCKQIRDHIAQVKQEMESEIKRNAKPRVDVTARMTGDGDEA